MLEKNNISHRFKLNEDKQEDTKSLKFVNLPLKNENKEIEIAEVPTSDIQEELKTALLEKIETTPVWFEYSQNRQRELIKNFIDNKINSENIQLSDLDKDVIIDNFISSISDFGAIQYLLDNEKVSKVIVNGCKNVLIEIENKTLNTEMTLTEKQMSFILRKISLSGIKTLDGVNTCKTDKYFIKVIGNDICKTGYNICIKKLEEINKEKLIKNQILTKEIFDLIVSYIENGKNIILAGPVNSCKTSILDAVMREIKFCTLLEATSEIECETPTRYQIDTQSKEFSDIIRYIQKNSFEYILADYNEFNTKIAAQKASLQTVQAKNTDDVLRIVFSAYINSGYEDKLAKYQALSDVDYIIFTDFVDGSPKVVNVLELSPAKTLPLSIKNIVEFKDKRYEINSQRKRLKVSTDK